MSKSELLGVYLEQNVLQQEKRLFTCSLCPYRTDRRNNLKRHQSTMHETSTAVLECCGNRFPNKAALRQHTGTFHVHGYICNICGRVFCRRALLRRHHAVHSGYKEFSCQLCYYATSHKSNLERHMKIHDSSTSTVTSADGIESATSSQSPGSFSDASDSRPLPSPAREHNPILASLLTQPAQGGAEVMQWIYHSPYDSYSAHAADPLQDDEGTLHPPKWDCDSEGRYLNRCNWEEVHHGGRGFAKETSSLPLRHAIDVILGLKEDAPKVRSNSWSRRSDLQSGGGLLSLIDSRNQVNSSIGHKRSWGESELEPLPVSSSDEVTLSADLDSSSECRADFQYVPKKLRMSKRYQSPI